MTRWISIERAEGKSLSAQDIPHRFTATALYDLPFFKSGSGFRRVPCSAVGTLVASTAINREPRSV